MWSNITSVFWGNPMKRNNFLKMRLKNFRDITRYNLFTIGGNRVDMVLDFRTMKILNESKLPVHMIFG
jgi:hypothetical protein